MQRTDPFCKHISRRLLNGKAPPHEFDTFTHVKGLLYKHITDAGKKFLALVIPKAWKFTVLMEAHDKQGHQGNSHIYSLIKCQYCWKGMWPEAFPIPDKSVDTIVATFINEYLPVHMCSQYNLSDNGTEFKNSLMNQVLQQLGIVRIFSAPYHPQSNGKLEVFHKYLKPTLKKLCEKDPANWDKYLNQVLAR